MQNFLSYRDCLLIFRIHISIAEEHFFLSRSFETHLLVNLKLNNLRLEPDFLFFVLLDKSIVLIIHVIGVTPGVGKYIDNNRQLFSRASALLLSLLSALNIRSYNLINAQFGTLMKILN